MMWESENPQALQMETYTGAYSRKSRMSTPQDPEAPLPGVHPRCSHTGPQKDTSKNAARRWVYIQGYSAYTHHNYMVLDCKRIQTMQKHITNNKKIIVIHNHTDLFAHSSIHVYNLFKWALFNVTLWPVSHSKIYSKYYLNVIIFNSCIVFCHKGYHNLLNQCPIVGYLDYLNLFTVKQNFSEYHCSCILAFSSNH